MKLLRSNIIALAILLSVSGFGQGLKDYYKDYFPIGVAVTPQSLTGDEAELIKSQFNSLTAENVMKWEKIHPEEGRYDWEAADKIVAFAQANNLKVRGHCLVWHRQTPDWVFKDATKEILLQRMKEHITAVVSHYKGKIYAWDVVNEAIDDDGNYRESQWYKIIGKDYIAKAFEYAHEADRDAILFYNDYNMESAPKRQGINKLIQKLISASEPIGGIGIQGHWSINSSIADIEEATSMFTQFHLPVQITELDVSVYHHKSDPQSNYTPEMEERQIILYKSLFEFFRSNKKYITGVTFWNVSDRHSWLDNFPVKGRKNYPLLFDQQLKPKRAYFEVVKF
ncbi:MAG: endo-1,4-beta-xylanase [Bacteroidota bacterium]